MCCCWSPKRLSCQRKTFSSTLQRTHIPDMKWQRQTATSAGVGHIPVAFRKHALREQCFGDVRARAFGMHIPTAVVSIDLTRVGNGLSVAIAIPPVHRCAVRRRPVAPIEDGLHPLNTVAHRRPQYAPTTHRGELLHPANWPIQPPKNRHAAARWARGQSGHGRVVGSIEKIKNLN
jgi:hypothetical protein